MYWYAAYRVIYSIFKRKEQILMLDLVILHIFVFNLRNNTKECKQKLKLKLSCVMQNKGKPK